MVYDRESHYTKAPVSARVTEEAKDALERIRERTGASKTEVLRVVIDRGLADLPDGDDDLRNLFNGSG